MSEDVDSEEQIVTKALHELRNLDIQSDSPVVGKDLREIISKQMELSSALFERQHRDVLRQMKLNRDFFERQHQDIEKMHSSVKLFTSSALRLEKLTYALIGLTLLLGGWSFIVFLLTRIRDGISPSRKIQTPSFEHKNIALLR